MAGEPTREGGYIKLYRQLRSSPVWKALRGDQRAVLIEILFLANWRPATAFWHGRPYEVGRGELAHSLETIARGDGEEGSGAGVSVAVVRSTVATLLRDHGNGPFLEERYPLPNTGPSTGPRVLKIVNYEKFQDVPEEASHRISHRPRTDLAQREEGEEGEEEDLQPSSKRSTGQVVLLPKPPPPPPRTPFGAFVASRWPDVKDPDRLGLRLAEAHPRVDLLAEAKKAALWESTRSAPKRDHARFLVNWMASARPAVGPAATPARREVIGMDENTGRPIYREA